MSYFKSLSMNVDQDGALRSDESYARLSVLHAFLRDSCPKYKELCVFNEPPTSVFASKSVLDSPPAIIAQWSLLPLVSHNNVDEATLTPAFQEAECIIFAHSSSDDAKLLILRFSLEKVRFVRAAFQQSKKSKTDEERLATIVDAICLLYSLFGRVSHRVEVETLAQDINFVACAEQLLTPELGICANGDAADKICNVIIDPNKV